MAVPFWLQHCGRVGQKQPGGFAPVGAVWGLSARRLQQLRSDEGWMGAWVDMDETDRDVSRN